MTEVLGDPFFWCLFLGAMPVVASGAGYLAGVEDLSAHKALVQWVESPLGKGISVFLLLVSAIGQIFR